MNDYEILVRDLETAISNAETAQNNAVDPQDEYDIQIAIDYLNKAHDRALRKV